MNRVQNEDGFTLMELLIASIIVSILIGSVGAALLVGLKTTDSIATRFNNSHDAQLLASWLDPDIISAGPPNGAIDSGPVDTGCSGTQPPGTNVVRFKWTGAEDGTTRYASYRRNGTLLTRYYCVAPGPILKTVVVVHNLDTANPPVWDSAAKKLSVTVNADKTSYAFAVSGNPRYGIVAVGATTTTTAPTTTTTAPTTTTTAPTTTTTAPTTTTTTQACTYVSGTANPASSARKNSGSNTGQINNDVVITVTTSGSCSSISVNFSTGGSSHTVSLTGGPTSWTATILKGAYNDWTVGSHPFTVLGTTSSPTIAFSVT